MVPFRSVRNHVSKIKVKNETPEEGYADRSRSLFVISALYLYFVALIIFLTFDYVLEGY
jgi:hypothetical protein